MPDPHDANDGEALVGAGPWEPWEARRGHLPARPSREVQEARGDVRLLLRVVRAWQREGRIPVEYGPELERATTDPRLSVRQRRIAASLLAEIRIGAVARLGPAARGRAEE